MKKFLLLFGIFIGAFCFGNGINAEQISSYYLVDSFNYYNNGDLTTVDTGDWNTTEGMHNPDSSDAWVQNSGLRIDFTVQGTTKYEGDKGLSCSYSAADWACSNSINFATNSYSTVGSQRFFLKFTDQNNIAYISAFSTTTSISSSNHASQLMFLLKLVGTSSNAVGTYATSVLSLNVWHSIDVQWSNDHNYTNGSDQWRYRIDYYIDEAQIWSDWYDFFGDPPHSLGTGIKQLMLESWFANDADQGNTYFDYFSYAPADSGFFGQGSYENSYNGAYIEPDFPADCYYNTDVFTGEAVGSITNPASSTIHWYAIEMVANDYYTEDRIYSSTTVDINPGETKSYSIDYDLSDTTLWEIAYILYGQDINTNLYTYVTHTGENTCPGDITTWIGEPSSTTLELLECDIEVLGSDCAASSSEFTWTESLLCEISETMRGTFIPSCSGQAKLDRYIKTLKHRAPYNYVSKLGNFIGDLVYPTTTATTTEDILATSDELAKLTLFIDLRIALKGLLYIVFGIALFLIIKKMFK